MRRCVGLAMLAAGLSTAAVADEPVPAPAGARLLTSVIADGVQVYQCQAKGSAFEWVFVAPEASLFGADGRQVGKHYGGPSWEAEDGSVVVGEPIGRADAPAAGSIPWLVLKAKSHTGEGAMASVAFVRRIDTRAGAAPATGCDPAHVGQSARMRYSATYLFYAAS